MLTARRQQQAICDLLKGSQPELELSQLTPPYDFLWEVVTYHLPDRYGALEALLSTKGEHPDLSPIIDTIAEMRPAAKQKYETLAAIGPSLPDVTWYWPDWIPRGLLTVLAADAGIGKTNVALDLGRRNIMGLPGPDGAPLDIRSGNIIYVDAEGFLPVVYNRLAGWDMNLNKFYPVQRPAREMLDLGAKSNQDQLIDMCYDLKADMLIIDSLSTIISKGENNVEDFRDLLNFLADLAKDSDLALLLIHHLRKQANGQTSGSGPVSQHDLRGSGHLGYMARSIMGLYIPGLDANGPRRLHMVKTNLCAHPLPLVMSYTPAPHNPSVLMISYEQSEKPIIPNTNTGDCAHWLLDMLADGPLSYAHLREQALEEGYNETMLQDARRKLDWQVIDTKGVKIKGNKWALYRPEEAEDGENHMAHHMANSPITWLNYANHLSKPPDSISQNAENSDHMATHGPCDSIPLDFLGGGISHGPCDPCDNSRNKRRQNDPISPHRHLSHRRKHRRPGNLAAPAHRRNPGNLSRLPGAVLGRHHFQVAKGMVRGAGRPAAPGRTHSTGAPRRSL
jgi:hypothetical protein